MYISEIRKKWDNGDYTYKTVIPKKVPEDHVFDEELSVRRNRELAKEHNQKVIELRTELQKQQNLLHQQLTDDVVKYIQENYNLNESQARKVERFVYQEYHSYMSDYFCYIDTFAEFASDLINMEN
jgi:hypothetical protein